MSKYLFCFTYANRLEYWLLLSTNSLSGQMNRQTGLLTTVPRSVSFKNCLMLSLQYIEQLEKRRRVQHLKYRLDRISLFAVRNWQYYWSIGEYAVNVKNRLRHSWFYLSLAKQLVAWRTLALCLTERDSQSASQREHMRNVCEGSGSQISDWILIYWCKRK